MNIKKAITLLLCVSLLMFLFTQLTPAASQTTATEKADTLNKLSLLQGDEKGYNFEGQLKRSEASTFIVRLLGKEAFLLNNKGLYISNKLKDVKSDAWYAPYVGYCNIEGIIEGYSDGTYKPENTITQKEFTTLVLGILGYVINSDFSWSNVYKFAGEKIDAKYSNLTGDNKAFTRRDAIELLYAVLDKKPKNSGKTVVESLIANGISNKKAAIDAGLITDDKVTSIQSTTVQNETSLTIAFNEQIQDIQAANISIYETANANNKLSVTVGSLSGQLLNLRTGTQVPGKEYTVEILNIKDADGFQASKVTSAFKGYINPVVESDFFHIKKIEALDRETINIYFTQPININAEIPIYYSIKQAGKDFVKGSFDSMKLKVIPGTNNGVSMKIIGQHYLTGESYTLSVNKDFNSIYGMYLSDGKGESRDFIGNGGNAVGFSLQEVQPENNKTIKVIFNKVVDSNSAQSLANYSVTRDGGIPVSILRSYIDTDEGGGKVVILGLLQALEDGKVYDVTIKDIYDGYKQDKLTEQKVSIAGLNVTQNMNIFIYAEAADNGTINVYSERPIDPTFVQNKELYTITAEGYSTQPQNVYYDKNTNPYLVKIYLPTGKELVDGKQYKLNVSRTISDYIGHFPSADTQLDFSGKSAQNSKPALQSALIIGSKNIKLTFSEEISNSLVNTNSGNISLEYKSGSDTKTIAASSISYINATTLVVNYDDALSYSTDYTIRMSNIQDYAGNHIRTSSEGGTSASVIVGR